MSASWALALLFFAIPAAGWALLDALRCPIRSLPLGWALSVASGFALISVVTYLPFALTGSVVFWPALGLLGVGALYTCARACARWRATWVSASA